MLVFSSFHGFRLIKGRLLQMSTVDYCLADHFDRRKQTFILCLLIVSWNAVQCFENEVGLLKAYLLLHLFVVRYFLFTTILTALGLEMTMVCVMYWF